MMKLNRHKTLKKKHNLQNQNKKIQKEDAKKASSSVLRKCCACGKITDKNDLIRVLCEHTSGEYIINPNNKQFGRSFYICKSIECLKLAIKKKRLKVLSEEQIETLKKLLVNYYPKCFR